MTESRSLVLVGVIGGSGLYDLDNLTFVWVSPQPLPNHTDNHPFRKHVNPETVRRNDRCIAICVLDSRSQPWGYPSSPITIASLPSGTRVAFLARHGAGHTLSPSAIPARANIAALKSLGVRAVLAFSAVGSLREDMPPGTFALPTQIIDRTRGVRPASFFDSSVVAHAAFGDPFGLALVRWLAGPVGRTLLASGVKLVTDACIVCMEGPQFSTRAESIMYRQWGGDLINMSVLPEAKLAREAEIRCVPSLMMCVTGRNGGRSVMPSSPL